MQNFLSMFRMLSVSTIEYFLRCARSRDQKCSSMVEIERGSVCACRPAIGVLLLVSEIADGRWTYICIYIVDLYILFPSFEPAKGIVIFLHKGLYILLPRWRLVACRWRMAIQFLLILLMCINVSYRGCGRRWIVIRVALLVLIFVRYHHEGIHLGIFFVAVVGWLLLGLWFLLVAFPFFSMEVIL